MRPGHGFSQHWLGAINGVTDDLQFLIVKDTSQSATSTTYLVMIADANLNAVVLHSGQSTHNSMIATTQTIGQELFGSHGASADPEVFRQTQVSHAANQFAVSGALVDRTTNGGVADDNPPLGGWLVTPANRAGGAFVTACCTAASPTPFSGKLHERQGVGLQQIKAVLSQHHDAVGTAALQAPSKDLRVARLQVEKFFAAQKALGRVTLQGSHVERLEFLSARAVSDRLDALDVGVTSAAPVVLATLSGRFDVSAPRRGKSATYSTAEAVFDARSGNLLTMSLSRP